MTKQDARPQEKSGTKRHFPRFPDSIFFRCLIALAITLVLVVGLVTAKSYRATTSIATSMVVDLGTEITGLVAQNSAASIRFRKVEDVEANITSVLERLGYRASGAMVLAADGEVIFDQNTNELGSEVIGTIAEQARATGEPQASAERLIFAHPVIHSNGEVIGVVALDWSTQAMYSQVAGEKETALLLAFLSSVVLIGVIGLLMKRMVSRPLMAIAHAMRGVADGNYDTDIPKLRRGNEIGVVARTLEEFRDQLRASEATRREAAFKGAAIDGGSAGLMLADADRNITYVSPALMQFLSENAEKIRSRLPDFDPDALLGSSVDQFHRNARRNQEMLEAMGTDPHETDLEFSGLTINLILSAIDSNGERIGYSTEWIDVTQSRLNEAILASFDANQARAEFDAAGHLVDGNETFMRLSGVAPGKAGAEFAKLVSDDGGNTVDPAMDKFGDFRITGMDGPAGVVHGGLSPVRNRSGKLVRSVLIGADVTAERASAAAAAADREKMLADQEMMIDSLRQALEALADGDLTTTISNAFAGTNDSLREDFNAAVMRLEGAIRAVVDRSSTIRSEVADISGAADDLSRRTEHQAATLEQTAAALAEITASVSSAAEGARKANDVVSAARTNAETSGGVVQDAVSAMGQIAESSSKISSIISVIDDIAFQTNLLALNAGVEAARAGDAGRGFAVVASEVRALAQRSSDAAREINSLISASGEHVERGVTLVGNAGDALKQIVESVSGISGYVADIAASAQEQSSGLAEINAAMSQLDQVTQQNAAMFEETTAASRNLSKAAEDLEQRVSQFTVARPRKAGDAAAAGKASGPEFRHRPTAAPNPDRSSPKPAAVPLKATGTDGAPGTVTEDEMDDDWTDF